MSSSSPIQTPVTGGEETSDQRQAAHALAQFYRALNSRDLRLMQENWANSAEAVMDDLHEAGDVFYVIGRERGELDVNGRRMPLAIRTTRIFRRDADKRWRQVHHHGSIDDPHVLAAYQDAVLQSPPRRTPA